MASAAGEVAVRWWDDRRKEEELQYSFLYPDGYLCLTEDPDQWIQANPNSLHLLTSLELMYDGRDEKKISDSIAHLTELSHLRLHCRSLKYLPNAIASLQKLQHLELEGLCLEEWPPNLGQLVNLTHLSLSNCYFTKSLPNTISKFPNLVSLKLFGFHESTEVALNLDKLFKLKHLSLVKCSGVKSSIDFINKLSNLETLDLTGCCSLKQSLGKLNLGALVSLTSLRLCSCGITFLLDCISMPKLLNLQNLHLTRSWCHKTEMPSYLVRLAYEYNVPNLLPTNLGVIVNNPPKSLPANLDVLVSLKHLSVAYYEFESLPHSFTRLTNLETLDLKKCHKLKQLSVNMGKLFNLRHLSLSVAELAISESIRSSLAMLINLETLYLSGSDYIDDALVVQFPTKMDGLVTLKSLSLVYCSLKYVVSSLIKLTNLETLYLRECEDLEQFPPNMIHLVSLKSLAVMFCSIKYIPSDVTRLSKLETLNFSPCEDLKFFPGNIRGMARLRHLTLKWCDIVEFPAHMNLKSLQIEGCDMLKELPSNLNVVHLNLVSPKIKYLPCIAGLQSLDIRHTKIKCLPMSLVAQSNLQFLFLPKDFKLETLAHNLKDSAFISVEGTLIRERCWKELKKELQPFVEEMFFEGASLDSGQRIINWQTSPEKLLNVRDADRFPEASRLSLKRKSKEFGIKWQLRRKRKLGEHNNELPSTSNSLQELQLLAHHAVKLLDGENQHVLSDHVPFNCTAANNSAPDPETTGTASQYRTDGPEHAPEHLSGTGNQCALSKAVEENRISSSSFVVKATYKEDAVRFNFSSTASVAELKEEVAKNLELELDSFKMKYQDEEKEWMLITRKDHLDYALGLSTSSGSKIVRLLIVDL